MKKIILYLLPISFLLFPFILHAQLGPKELPDGSFENCWEWMPGGFNGPYWEYSTDYFFTLNSLFLEKNDQGEPDITAWREGNAQQGTWCIKLVSGEISVGEDVFLPGMVGTINEDFVSEFINSGGEVTVFRDWYGYDTPHALEGWYKYSPKNNDSALIDIGFYDGEDNLVCIEQLILKNPVGAWTPFFIEIPHKYWDQKFAGIRVLFVASAGVNFDDLKKCKGQKGSTLWIDNISLNYTYNGIKQNLFSSLKTKTFPNPAAETLNIEMNESFSGKVLIYDLLGSLVMEDVVCGTKCQLNISSLAAGNYVYKLMNENTIFAQGKFLITK